MIALQQQLKDTCKEKRMEKAKNFLKTTFFKK